MVVERVKEKGNRILWGREAKSLTMKITVEKLFVRLKCLVFFSENKSMNSKNEQSQEDKHHNQYLGLKNERRWKGRVLSEKMNER